MVEKPKLRTLWVTIVCASVSVIIIAGSDGFSGFTIHSTEPTDIAIELLLSILIWAAFIGLPTLMVLCYLRLDQGLTVAVQKRRFQCPWPPVQRPSQAVEQSGRLRKASLRESPGPYRTVLTISVPLSATLNSGRYRLPPACSAPCGQTYHTRLIPMFHASGKAPSSVVSSCGAR
jgi:hypothetical protein